jgi:hypothetical protein
MRATSSRSTNACNPRLPAPRATTVAPRDSTSSSPTNRRRVGGAQHARARQRRGPRKASAHVVLEETAIEAKRPSERDERRVGISLKTPRPQVCH